MNARIQKPNRRGATLVEMAIALSLFISLMLGFVDLGYGVFRQHVLTQATRQLARHAIVRGELADRMTSWGPTRVSIMADSDHEVARYVAPKLVGWKLEEVDIDVQWPDGGNDVRRGDRIRVAVSAPYHPIMTFILGNPSFDLTAQTTMAMSH